MEINENDARGGADCHDSGYHRGGDCRDGSIDVGQDERMREILDYYRGLPERSSQESSFGMGRPPFPDPEQGNAAGGLGPPAAFRCVPNQ